MTRRANLITDVAGLTVGNADDPHLASGVTVTLFDPPAVAGVFVPGGAPAGRDQECLEPDRTVDRVDAIVLSGGSGFGLDAATGVQAWLRERGRGIAVGAAIVPITPTAILFDLGNGGNKDWGRYPPYRELGYAACEAASHALALGTAGAGFGATTVDLKGGLGSASAFTRDGHVVAALVAANSLGSAVVGEGPHFWAAPYEQDEEFGGLGSPARVAPASLVPRWKGGTPPSTTLALVATDAVLTKAQAKRLAIVAAGGLPRALRLAGAAMDGDTVFAASTGRRPLSGIAAFTELGVLAADCVARAVARGIYEATSRPSQPSLPSWRERFGTATG